MKKIDYPALFEKFEGREQGLRKVVRYHIYSPMYYRSNLFTHSKRVLWLLQSVLPLAEEVFGGSFDSTKAQLMAVVHDDPEIVMGDIQAGHKNKMSAQQLAEIARQEHEAVEKMAERYPYSVLGYTYADLLRESQKVNTLESKLLKYADRFDAFGEALHEVYAGNKAFTTQVIDKNSGPIDFPTTFYQLWLPAFPQKNPEFKILFAKKHPLFTIPDEFNMHDVVKTGSPHSPDSITRDFSFAPYNTWKNCIIKNNDDEEIEHLFTQIEFEK